MSIKFHDLEFDLYINKELIDQRISYLASEISNAGLQENPIFIVMLNGAFIFASDLYRKIELPKSEITFMKPKSYQGTKQSKKIDLLLSLDREIKGRDIIIIEDIIDTGNTLEFLIEQLRLGKPNSIKICTLLFKREAYSKNYPIDFYGFEIDNKFVLGYGLDYNEQGRLLPDIYIAKNLNE